MTIDEKIRRLATIRRLSEIRSHFNCFDESEEPFYRALSESIRIIYEEMERNDE